VLLGAGVAREAPAAVRLGDAGLVSARVGVRLAPGTRLAEAVGTRLAEAVGEDGATVAAGHGGFSSSASRFKMASASALLFAVMPLIT
jgi:hypothetical protein